MSIRNFICLSLTAALLGACSSESKQEGTPIVIDDDEMPTVASVTIKTTGNGTRAIGFPGVEPTTEESAVSNLAVFVFNKQKMLEQVVTDTFSIPIEGQKEIEIEFESTTGLHYLYGALNLPDTDFATLTSLSGISMDNFLSRTISRNAIDDFIGEGSGSNGFTMTNTGDAVSAVFVETTTASDNSIVIPVGRTVAKVAVGFEPENEQGGKLSEVEYKVINNPKEFYFMPKYNQGVLYSPHWSDASVVANKFMSQPAHDYQFAITSTTAEPDNTWTYCMENANAKAKEGNTTMIALKGIFTPDQLLDKEGKNSTPAADGTFWRIAKVDPSGNALYYNPGYYSEEPLSSIMDADELAFEYKQGVTYYPVWLTSTDTQNKYNVKRNSYYKVTITSVSGAGYNDEDGGGGLVVDPEIPIEGEAMVKAIIQILDWAPEDQEVHI